MPTTRGSKFDKGELEEAAKHLAFDVHHFRGYIRLHRDGRLWQYPPIIAQAVRYSLLLHLRVLLSFFSGSPRNDDCSVIDFTLFPGVATAWRSGALTPPDDAKKVALNLNKRLAHLTATRWRESAPPLDFYEKYFSGVEALVERFQAALPDEVRQVFASQVDEWEAKHPAGPRTCASTSTLK